MPSGPAQVAQLVEQRTENPRVGSSILSLGTTFQRLTLRVIRAQSREARLPRTVV